MRMQGDCMNKRDIMNDISRQAREMRRMCVEPTAVYLDSDTYAALGKPLLICGLPVECDTGLRIRWAVR